MGPRSCLSQLQRQRTAVKGTHHDSETLSKTEIKQDNSYWILPPDLKDSRDENLPCQDF